MGSPEVFDIDFMIGFETVFTISIGFITITSFNPFSWCRQVPDCAQHPADIRGNPWLVTSCESCGVEEAPSYVAPTVSCAAGSEMSPAATSPTASPAPASPGKD